MNTIRQNLQRILSGQGSRFVLVKFVKKDGTVREMLIQHAATKFHVKGLLASPSAQQGARTRALNCPELFNTYDMDRRAIRSVNLDTVLEIKSGDVLYKADDARTIAIIDGILKEVA